MFKNITGDKNHRISQFHAVFLASFPRCCSLPSNRMLKGCHYLSFSKEKGVSFFEASLPFTKKKGESKAERQTTLSEKRRREE